MRRDSGNHEATAATRWIGWVYFRPWVFLFLWTACSAEPWEPVARACPEDGCPAGFLCDEGRCVATRDAACGTRGALCTEACTDAMRACTRGASGNCIESMATCQRGCALEEETCELARNRRVPALRAECLGGCESGLWSCVSECEDGLSTCAFATVEAGACAVAAHACVEPCERAFATCRSICARGHAP